MSPDHESGCGIKGRNLASGWLRYLAEDLGNPALNISVGRQLIKINNVRKDKPLVVTPVRCDT
jgi:hypothetical protein